MAMFRKKCQMLFTVAAENAHAAKDCPEELRELLANLKRDNAKMAREEYDTLRKAKQSGNNGPNVAEPMEQGDRAGAVNLPGGDNDDLAALNEAYRKLIVESERLLKAADESPDEDAIRERIRAARSGAKRAGVDAKSAEKASKSVAKRKRVAATGLYAASSTCSRKHAEASSGLAGANADETPASQGNSTKHRQPAKKKPRLDTLAEHDEGTATTSRKTRTSRKRASNNRSNSDSTVYPGTSASEVHEETLISSLDDEAPSDNASRHSSTALRPRDSGETTNIESADAKRDALLQAMLAGPAEFRELLKLEGWPEYDGADYDLLEAAVKLRHAPITCVLLDEGCRATGARGAKAFRKAVRLGWLDAAALCLARGAQVGWQDSVGNTALHVAFFYKASETMMQLLARKLVEETSVSVANRGGLSTWHLLCGPGSRAELVEAALARGYAKVHRQVPLESTFNFPGYTALHFAVQYNRLKTARVLLGHGADLYARNSTQSTPLHLACKLGLTSMLDLLLTYDEYNNDLVDDQGLTHFMCACVGTQVERVKEFMELRTPQSIKTMVENRVKEGPHAGCTASDLARKFGRQDVVEVLLSCR